jgi:hypothetical protein
MATDGSGDSAHGDSAPVCRHRYWIGFAAMGRGPEQNQTPDKFLSALFGNPDSEQQTRDTAKNMQADAELSPPRDIPDREPDAEAQFVREVLGLDKGADLVRRLHPAMSEVVNTERGAVALRALATYHRLDAEAAVKLAEPEQLARSGRGEEEAMLTELVEARPWLTGPRDRTSASMSSIL